VLLTLGFSESSFLTIKGICWPLLSTKVLLALTFYDFRIYKNLIIRRPRSIFAMNQKDQMFKYKQLDAQGETHTHLREATEKVWCITHNAEI
jgi:hypothetical protein